MSNWNQNQNQGGAYDDVLDRINGAKPAKAGRDPFIMEGSHEMIVCSIEVFQDKAWGATVRGTFELVSSTNPACRGGTTYAKLWNLKKPAKFESQETDADNFVDFVCKVQNTQLGQHGAACTALIKTSREHPGGQLERQPARGVRVRCTGRNNTAKTYVAVTWSAASVEQNLETISKTRADLDMRRPFFESAQQTAPVPPQMQQAPQAPVQPYVAPAWPNALQMQPPGGFGQYVQPTAPAAPVPSKPPWNPAWGPIPPGY